MPPPLYFLRDYQLLFAQDIYLSSSLLNLVKSILSFANSHISKTQTQSCHLLVESLAKVTFYLQENPKILCHTLCPQHNLPTALGIPPTHPQLLAGKLLLKIDLRNQPPPQVLTDTLPPVSHSALVPSLLSFLLYKVYFLF